MAIDSEHAKQRVYAIRRRVAGPPEDRDSDLTPEDRNILIEFDNELTADRRNNDRCGWYHHANTLSQLYGIATETNRLADTLQDNDAGRRALNEITEWITEAQDYSDYTIQGKLSSLRVFASTVRDELPEHFEEIEPGSHVDEDPAPLPGNIIEYPDAISMATEANFVRDRALVLTQWAAGMRPMEELWTLQRGQIEFFSDHAKITLPARGKTDRHDIIIVVGSQQLRKWVEEEHPAHHDPESSMGPETFIWTSNTENSHLAYGSMTARFDKLAERAGIEKDHSAQHFRRSSASILAAQPHISERDLRNRYSWSPRSSAPEHYIAAFSAATSLNVARTRGRDVEDLDDIKQYPDTAPVVCERCGDWTTRGLEECVWCQYNLDDEQTTLAASTSVPMQDPRSAGEKDLAQMLLDGDVSADDLRTLRKLETTVKTDPKLFDRLDELIVKADALEDAADEEESGSALAVSDPLGIAAYVSGVATAAGRKWARAKHLALRLHPGFEHYPPQGPRLAGLLSGWLLLLVGAFGMWSATGVLDEVLAGDPLMLLALVISLAVGGALVHRDLPDVEEALRAAQGN